MMKCLLVIELLAVYVCKCVCFMKTEISCMLLISISPVFRTVLYIPEALKETHTHSHTPQNLSTTMQILMTQLKEIQSISATGVKP